MNKRWINLGLILSLNFSTPLIYSEKDEVIEKTISEAVNASEEDMILVAQQMRLLNEAEKLTDKGFVPASTPIVSSSHLTEIHNINKKIIVDIKYATPHNIFGEALYSSSKAILLEHVIIALNEVQKDLEKEGLGLKVWDAYRPLSIQWKLWNRIPDEKYVSNPLKQPRHTRGTAVDLTLVDLASGKELDMGTNFDDLTYKAHSDCSAISQEAKANRNKLKEAMEKHGFEQYKFEWWHFDYSGWENYPQLNMDFSAVS